jgi:hypothetical protein
MEPVISSACFTLELRGQSKEGVLSLLGWKGKNCESCDPVFMCLHLDGDKYTHVDDNGFTQWVYLAFPEAFKSALRGTRFDSEDCLSYCFQSKCKLLSNRPAGKSRLRWNISVNYLVSTCCADGIGIEQRDFELNFYQE